MLNFIFYLYFCITRAWYMLGNHSTTTELHPSAPVLNCKGINTPYSDVRSMVKRVGEMNLGVWHYERSNGDLL